jgi:hypothetical protein
MFIESKGKFEQPGKAWSLTVFVGESEVN